MFHIFRDPELHPLPQHLRHEPSVRVHQHGDRGVDQHQQWHAQSQRFHPVVRPEATHPNRRFRSKP